MVHAVNETSAQRALRREPVAAGAVRLELRNVIAKKLSKPYLIFLAPAIAQDTIAVPLRKPDYLHRRPLLRVTSAARRTRRHASSRWSRGRRDP
jgi:hypothetical protein